MTKKKEYKKLPGRVIVGTGARLWLGKDHLLSVKNPGFSEEYMRFYYRDIQAIVTTKTGKGIIWNLVLGVCIFITLILTVQTLPIPVSMMIAGVFMFFLVVNVLLGPTCKCTIQTAVNLESLPSLRRVRTARKAIGMITPLIEKAQGGLTRADIVTMSKDKPPEIRRTAPSAMPISAEAPAEMSYYSGIAHLALFSVLLLDGIEGAVDIFVNSMALTVLGLLVSLSFVITAVIALVKQQGRTLNRGMRQTAWAALIYVCVTYVLGYVIYMYVFFQDPAIANDRFGVIKTLTYLNPFEHPFILTISTLTSVTSLTIGGIGIYYYSVFKAEESRKGLRPA